MQLFSVCYPRGATTEIDGALSNPAGLAFLLTEERIPCRIEH